MNGYQRGDEHIYVTHFPGLKKPVLAVGNKYVMQKIASFDSEECAEGFNKMLNKWFGFDSEDDG